MPIAVILLIMSVLSPLQVILLEEACAGAPFHEGGYITQDVADFINTLSEEQKAEYFPYGFINNIVDSAEMNNLCSKEE